MKQDRTGSRPATRPPPPVAWPAALAAVLSLLCILAPAQLTSVAVSAASGRAHGAANASDPSAGTSAGQYVQESCTTACGTQPRLQRDGFAERFTSLSGVAPLPAHLYLAPPATGAASPPAPDESFGQRPTTGHDGRAPPLPPGT
jgi:hypothetical protein